MIFVTRLTKRSAEDHFDTAYELENELALAGKFELLKLARRIAPEDMICSYVRQPRALGFGHAALCAKELVGCEAFAALLADDLMVGKPAITAQMMSQFAHLQASIIAVQDVPRKHIKRYGIVSGHSISADLEDIDSNVEKPMPEVAPTTLAVAERYILTPDSFEELEALPRGVGSEIQLTDGIAQLLQREKVFAFRYQGARYDCSSKLGFLQTTVDLVSYHDAVGVEFAQGLKNRHSCSEQPYIHSDDGLVSVAIAHKELASPI
jgi:UTP--glucose-1-phosphate uridylyltransferase